MSEISANILPNKNTVERKSGFISHTDAVNLVRDLQRESEYKQQVTARVTKVYTSQFDLPILTRNDGVDTPAWNMFGKIDVELNHNGKVINNIGSKCSHFICLPLVDEEVILDEHEGTIYYDFPLNRLGKVNHNRVNKITGERQVFESLTYHARPVAPQHGDTIIQGRFGNYINLTSELEMNAKPAYPKIVIGNMQDTDGVQVRYKNYDKYFPHFHNANSIGSCIEFTSSPRNADIQPSALETELEDFWDTSGNLITITSDQLIFNSRVSSISMHSADDISFTCLNDINLVGMNQVSLGKTDATNPAVKGTQMRGFMNELLLAVTGFVDTLSTTGDDDESEFLQKTKAEGAADQLKTAIDTMRTKYIGSDIENSGMVSKKVFLE